MRVIIIIVLLSLSSFIKAQDGKLSDYTRTNKHSILFIISHTQINEGLDENGKKQWLSLPSWGLNYNYSLSKKWAIGMHTDIVVEDFIVDNHSKQNAVIERSYPIASAIVISFKPGKDFSFLLGSGAEFSKGNNFLLIRAGLEYGLHINKNWEFIANIINDYKFSAYNSWSLGMGIVYKF
jgi:hypothetical protein